MLCPKCGFGKSDVINSRPKGRDGIPYPYICRRRSCKDCKYKFTTYETIEKPIGSKAKISYLRAEEILDKIRGFLAVELNR